MYKKLPFLVLLILFNANTLFALDQGKFLPSWFPQTQITAPRKYKIDISERKKNILPSHVRLTDPYCDKVKFKECEAEAEGLEKYDCIWDCFTEPLDGETRLYHGKYYVILPEEYKDLGEYKLSWMLNCDPKIADYLGIQPKIKSQNIVNRFVYEPETNARSIYTMHGVISYYDEDKIGYYTKGISDENITSCIGDVLKHELTHLYVANTPLPRWLNEGLAMYISFKNLDVMICKEKGYYFDGWYSPYEDLSNKSVAQEDYGKYYKTGACFWDYIETEYGHEKFQQILKKLDEYRDLYGLDKYDNGFFIQCYPIDEPIYFLEDVVTPVLGEDISAITLSRFHFGHQYAKCK